MKRLHAIENLVTEIKNEEESINSKAAVLQRKIKEDHSRKVTEDMETLICEMVAAKKKGN